MTIQLFRSRLTIRLASSKNPVKTPRLIMISLGAWNMLLKLSDFLMQIRFCSRDSAGSFIKTDPDLCWLSRDVKMALTRCKSLSRDVKIGIAHSKTTWPKCMPSLVRAILGLERLRVPKYCLGSRNWEGSVNI